MGNLCFTLAIALLQPPTLAPESGPGDGPAPVADTAPVANTDTVPSEALGAAPSEAPEPSGTSDSHPNPSESVPVSAPGPSVPADTPEHDLGEAEPGSSELPDTGPKPTKTQKGKRFEVGHFEFDLDARVVAGARLKYEDTAIDSDGQPIGQVQRTGALQLRQARFRIVVRYRDVLTTRLSLDFADLLGSPSSGDVLRDAWGNIRIHDAFQIKVGHMKRPYSRLELRGASSIPMIGRGLYNGFAVEDLSWGDRAVGVTLWGKVKPKRPGLRSLGWSVSATNDAVSGAPHGVDLHARLTYDPTKWLSIAGGGAFKRVQDALADEATCRAEWKRGPDCRRSVFGASFDVEIDHKGLYASVESNFSQDWLFAETSPWIAAVHAYLTYDFKIAKHLKLQPLLMGEYIDTNLSSSESEAVRAVAGLNLLWTKRLRILPQFQYVTPLAPVTATNHFVKHWVAGVWVSVQL